VLYRLGDRDAGRRVAARDLGGRRVLRPDDDGDLAQAERGEQFEGVDDELNKKCSIKLYYSNSSINT